MCHEWQQIKDGTICALELSQDLSHTVGEPRTLFAASAAKPWIRGIEHRIYGSDNYVTDGPFMYRCENGRLIMLWSSFGEEGYTQAMAFSDNDDITGNWKPASQLLFELDGGHGMIFKALDGTLYLALHSPNEHLLERPVFYLLEEQEGTLKVKGIKGEKQQ